MSENALTSNQIFNIIKEIHNSAVSESNMEILRRTSSEGYLGDTFIVKVQTHGESYHYFFKYASRSKKLREAAFIKEIFERERYFYLSLLPHLDRLCLKYTDKNFDLTPNCIYAPIAHIPEVLVMNDITKEGYRSFQSTGSFSHEQLLTVLMTYSKLHAYGFVLNKEQPKVFTRLTQNCRTNYLIEFAKRFGYGKAVSFILDLLKESSDDEIINKIDAAKDYVMNSLALFVELEDLETIVHMDCWTQNILYKHEDNTTKLESLKLVDFQFWTVSSPVFDLLHTIYVNVPSPTMLDNLDYYLNYYYSCLTKYIHSLGNNVGELYPFDKLLEQFTKYSWYGLMFGLILPRVLAAAQLGLPTFIDCVNKNKKLDEAFVFKLPDENESCEKAKILLKHFIKNEFI